MDSFARCPELTLGMFSTPQRTPISFFVFCERTNHPKGHRNFLGFFVLTCTHAVQPSHPLHHTFSPVLAQQVQPNLALFTGNLTILSQVAPPPDTNPVTPRTVVGSDKMDPTKDPGYVPTPTPTTTAAASSAAATSSSAAASSTQAASSTTLTTAAAAPTSTTTAAPKYASFYVFEAYAECAGNNFQNVLDQQSTSFAIGSCAPSAKLAPFACAALHMILVARTLLLYCRYSASIRGPHPRRIMLSCRR